LRCVVDFVASRLDLVAQGIGVLPALLGAGLLALLHELHDRFWNDCCCRLPRGQLQAQDAVILQEGRFLGYGRQIALEQLPGHCQRSRHIQVIVDLLCEPLDVPDVHFTWLSPGLGCRA
jgi:hypothetical protein